MISKPLFMRELKSNYKILLIFMVVMSLYISVVIAMFDPSIGDSFKMMAEAMPDLFAAFGMTAFSSVLIEFLAEVLYGFILIVIPLVFLVLLSNKLIGRYVDRGSMAYLLATPNTRRKIVTTQAIFSITANLCLVVFMIVLGIIVSGILFPGHLEIGKFLIVNFGLYTLLLFLSGLCFCSSCWFSDLKFSYGIGAGLCILFVVLKMLGQVSKDSKVFSYMTPITLFEPEKLIQFDHMAIAKAIILLVGGLIFYLIGILRFERKDLSI